MISGFGLRTQELSAGSFTVIGHVGGYYVDYWLHIMLSPNQPQNSRLIFPPGVAIFQVSLTQEQPWERGRWFGNPYT